MLTVLCSAQAQTGGGTGVRVVLLWERPRVMGQVG